MTPVWKIAIFKALHRKIQRSIEEMVCTFSPSPAYTVVFQITDLLFGNGCVFDGHRPSQSFFAVIWKCRYLVVKISGENCIFSSQSFFFLPFFADPFFCLYLAMPLFVRYTRNEFFHLKNKNYNKDKRGFNFKGEVWESPKY